MARSALFGVSIDSQMFGTADVRKALATGLQSYGRIVFLIADELNIYNRIAAASGDQELLLTTAIDPVGSNIRNERARWLQRVRAGLPDWPREQCWTVKGWSEVADGRAFAIHRRVRILYEIDEAFRADVDRCADDFARTHQLQGDSDIVRRLAVLYILEEIAVNLRMRVVNGVLDEYYMGVTFEMFRRVYAGEYSKSAHELAGIEGRAKASRYRFHDWDRAGGVWRDAEIASARRVTDLAVHDRRRS